MKPNESLSHITRLLESVPNTIVERSWCDDDNAHLVFKVDSLSMLALLVHHAEFSNFVVDVRFRGPSGPIGESTDAGALHFAIHPRVSIDSEPPSELEIFGIFLARTLKARGLIPAEYADELQRTWNAVVM